MGYIKILLNISIKPATAPMNSRPVTPSNALKLFTVSHATLVRLRNEVAVAVPNRAPLWFWDETSYTPERSEIVYCEKCYLQEIA